MKHGRCIKKCNIKNITNEGKDMTVVVDHNGQFKTISRYGVQAVDANDNIVGINGMTLKVEHLPEQKGDLSDYFIAWVNGVQGDGETHNEAVNNALKTKSRTEE
jgi:hypothetical protein